MLAAFNRSNATLTEFEGFGEAGQGVCAHGPTGAWLQPTYPLPSGDYTFRLRLRTAPNSSALSATVILKSSQGAIALLGCVAEPTGCSLYLAYVAGNVSTTALPANGNSAIAVHTALSPNSSYQLMASVRFNALQVLLLREGSNLPENSLAADAPVKDSQWPLAGFFLASEAATTTCVTALDILAETGAFPVFFVLAFSVSFPWSRVPLRPIWVPGCLKGDIFFPGSSLRNVRSELPGPKHLGPLPSITTVPPAANGMPGRRALPFPERPWQPLHQQYVLRGPGTGTGPWYGLPMPADPLRLLGSVVGWSWRGGGVCIPLGNA
jgi:hypothetical protein